MGLEKKDLKSNEKIIGSFGRGDVVLEIWCVLHDCRKSETHVEKLRG